MACIVYRKNKTTGITYAYRQESYRDPVTKKPRNTRTYLGRVDPVTNTIIPKGEPGTRNTQKISPEHAPAVIPPDVHEAIQQQEERIRAMRELIDQQQAQINRIMKVFKKMNVVISEMS